MLHVILLSSYLSLSFFHSFSFLFFFSLSPQEEEVEGHQFVFRNLFCTLEARLSQDWWSRNGRQRGGKKMDEEVGEEERSNGEIERMKVGRGREKLNKEKVDEWIEPSIDPRENRRERERTFPSLHSFIHSFVLSFIHSISWLTECVCCSSLPKISNPPLPPFHQPLSLSITIHAILFRILKIYIHVYW